MSLSKLPTVVMYADDIVLIAPSAKGLQNITDVCYAYGCDNDIIFNSSKSQVMFFDTMRYGHMNNIMLGQKTLNVTKSYTYLGHIITYNLCDEADIKAKVGCLYGRSNILLRKFYFCSERVKNRLFSSYCSNLYLCSLWANHRKSSMSRFIVSYNNAFRILHNLHMRCSASFMFANAVVDNCSTCIRKSIFSLMSMLNTSTNIIIVQSTINSDVYTTSELYQRWVKALYT